MVEIRFHGRGGQGTVVASKILADAIAKEDKWVQAYPEFGVERRGSPVVAFIRIDDKQIYDKSRIYTPDSVVVVDPTLVEAIDITEGLKPGGTIIINSDRRPEDFPFHGKFKVRTVNATEILRGKTESPSRTASAAADRIPGDYLLRHAVGGAVLPAVVVPDSG